MRVQFLWFAAYHAKQDHCSVLLYSNNRSKGKLGITFHHFPVDKYAKQNWIVRIHRYVGNISTNSYNLVFLRIFVDWKRMEGYS